MGKVEEEEQPLPELQESSDASAVDGNAGHEGTLCSSISRAIHPRCAAALLFGVAVLLSAVFWLPPFTHRHTLPGDPDPLLGVDVAASFKLQKSLELLNANIGKLQYDIFEEIGVPNSTVAVISSEPVAGSNWTDVVFGVWPYPKNTTLSQTGLSILRESFMSLVMQQSTLHLTSSLFGNSFFFQVLKFPGGITIIPPQTAFLLQKVHMLFNFTLNFPIFDVQDKIRVLNDQMKSGLRLNSYENLYVSLTNRRGSTVAPPTIVQTSIVLAVGNQPPPLPRLKQLAQTIKKSSAGNLGLNQSVFGSVKQIRLSSFLQRSLASGGSKSFSPSPAPQPHPSHHSHHHHNHHHHHHHNHVVPAASPQYSLESPAPSPSDCHFVFPVKPLRKVHMGPVAAPVDSPSYSPAPYQNEGPPSPSTAPSVYSYPVSPLPAVVLSHVHPPIESPTGTGLHDSVSSISPSLSPSSSVDVWYSFCGIVALVCLRFPG